MRVSRRTREVERSRVDVSAVPARRPRRISIVIPRHSARGFAWIFTVVVSAVAGWFASQRISPPGERRAPSAVVALTPEELRPIESAKEPQPEPLESAVPEETSSEPKAVSPPAGPKPQPEPVPTEALAAERSPPSTSPLPLTAPPPLEKVADPLPVTPPPVPITEGFARAERFADSGDVGDARSEAETLLEEYEDYSGMVAAFLASGTGEVRARLNALRVLQLGGLQAISTELARELKRSYASTPEVLEAIRDWRILKPQITKLDSSIEDRVGVVVTGELMNPDVGVVRRMLVEVEALDAAGNVLETIQVRVRPRTLEPGSAGVFRVEFSRIDPTFVLRTRATIVEWQSEVLESSRTRETIARGVRP